MIPERLVSPERRVILPVRHNLEEAFCVHVLLQDVAIIKPLARRPFRVMDNISVFLLLLLHAGYVELALQPRVSELLEDFKDFGQPVLRGGGKEHITGFVLLKSFVRQELGPEIAEQHP